MFHNSGISVMAVMPGHKKTRRQRGTPIRRPRFDGVKRQKYLEQIQQGVGRYAAAAAAGTSPRTIERHLEASKTFRDQVSQAELTINETVENALYQSAISGNVVAQQVWLYNRQPERWRDARSRVEVAGPGGVPIQVTVYLPENQRQGAT